MINELMMLADELESRGISTQVWDKDFKEVPKVSDSAPCARVWIGEDGQVSRIEPLDAHLAGSLRKFGNNQGSFPGFNVAPLYRLTDERQTAQVRKALKGQGEVDAAEWRSWCGEECRNWQEKEQKHVQRCLTVSSRELLKRFPEAEGQAKLAIGHLAEICGQIPPEGERSFFHQLEQCIWRQLERGEEVPLLLRLLIWCDDAGEKGGKKRSSPKVAIYLDLEQWERFGRPVANAQEMEAVNERLLASGNVPAVLGEGSKRDAFGELFENPKEPMPACKISGITVTLRSMYHTQKCQYRYGMIEDGSYPISAENRKRAKSALEWVAMPEHRNVLWVPLSREEVLIAYPDVLPDPLPAVANLFGQSIEKGVERRFEAAAEKYLKNIYGIPVESRPQSIRVFVLRKMDRSRVMVVYTRLAEAEQLTQAAESWISGCRNLPLSESKRGFVPFPTDVAEIVNTTWRQDGRKESGTARTIRDYQGIDLLLGTMASGMAEYLLGQLVLHARGLYLFVGDQRVRAKEKRAAEYQEAVRAVGQVSAVLALLLSVLNVRKETYMEKVPYLLGQVLKTSDALHELYCTVVRDGEMPTRLVGGAFFTSAAQAPVQTLAQLGLRMNPYITWAKTYRCACSGDDEETRKLRGRAGWLLGLYAQEMDLLADQFPESGTLSEAEQAQLMIGYLASFPRSRKAKKPGEDATEPAGAPEGAEPENVPESAGLAAQE